MRVLSLHLLPELFPRQQLFKHRILLARRLRIVTLHLEVSNICHDDEVFHLTSFQLQSTPHSFHLSLSLASPGLHQQVLSPQPYKQQNPIRIMKEMPFSSRLSIRSHMVVAPNLQILISANTGAICRPGILCARLTTACLMPAL